MLRGQGSLKTLLGQNVVASSYARKKRNKPDARAAAEPPAKRPAGGGGKAAPKQGASEQAATPPLFRSSSVGRPQSDDREDVRADPADAATPRAVAGTPEFQTPANGNRPSSGGVDCRSGNGATSVSCPICSRALSDDGDAINAHIDNCLTRSSAQRSKQRTVTAMFTSASASAARRCRQMVQQQALAQTMLQTPQQASEPEASQQQPAQLPSDQPTAQQPGDHSAAASSAAVAAGAGQAAIAQHVAMRLQADVVTQLPPSELLVGIPLLLDAEAAKQADAAARPDSLPCTPPAEGVPKAAATAECTTDGAATTQAGGARAEVNAAAVVAAAEEAAALRTPQKQIVSSQSRLTGASPMSSVTSFSACVVGRRFQPTAECADGEPVTVQHEPTNSRDRNALLVLGAQGQVLGHLPADVAKWLGPLVIAGLVDAAGTVVDDPASATCPITVALQVQLPPDAGLLSPRRQSRVRTNLQKAAIAAADNLQRQLALAPVAPKVSEWCPQGQRLGPGGVGGCLKNNFQLVAGTVRRCDEHLLAPEEHALLDTLQALPEASQCLFLRLLQRRGPWFRQRTLDYPEVGDTEDAVEKLVAAGLLACAAAADQRALLQMLTIPELKALAVALGLKLGGRAAASRDAILNWFAASLGPAEGPKAPEHVPEEELAEALSSVAGPCCRLTAAARLLMGRVRRLFFMSESQDLSRFLVTDLGICRYPQYRLNRPSSGFVQRSDMLDYEAALAHASVLDAAFEEGDMAAAEAALEPAWACIRAGHHKQHPAGSQLAQPFLRWYSAAWVYTTMATAGISLLEKQRSYGQATELLRQLLGGVCCQGRRGEWWLRLSIDTEHLGRTEESLEIAEAALADEWVKTGDRLALQRRVLRLGKPPRRWRKPSWAASASWEPAQETIVGKPLASVIGLKSKFLGADGEQCTVEEFALQHYASEDVGQWQGTHCEGGVWATLFGLLMWSVLFADVPEVFRTPFQSAPLDLGTENFYAAREPLIKERLQEIRDGQAVQLIRDCWEDNQGVFCRGVNWERHTLEELVVIAECVGGPGLAAVCHLLADDHSGWSGGMPDLLLWRVADKRAKLSEVKGPRDRLSDQQRAWAAALVGSGLEVEVLKVVETLPRKRR